MSDAAPTLPPYLPPEEVLRPEVPESLKTSATPPKPDGIFNKLLGRALKMNTKMPMKIQKPFKMKKKKLPVK